MTVLQNQMKQKLITEENIDMLKILAHPVRLQIVDVLMRHKKCNVTQLGCFCPSLREIKTKMKNKQKI
ncbi:hypothetical protein P4I94_27005 [Bacillus cereus]|nr:hypothetical protein [Bacillus cereus]MEB9482226.1 hypothetical protein [Bacillus cereus]